MISRHKARRLAFKAIFSWEINKETLFSDILLLDGEISNVVFAEEIFNGVLNSIEEIDDIIKMRSKNWEFERINKVDLAILRLGLFSLNEYSDTHKSITIDEAINLSKEFGTDNSFKFVNGILDSTILNEEVTLSK